MGNWMADEVLWRAKVHPSLLGAQINKVQEGVIYKQIIFVAKGAMKSVGINGGDPPKSWLFHTRWKDGLLCPKTKSTLIREQIGGRTTCWCPALQRKI
jgi:formamidopyrimidine-DNA glycosylase